MRRWMIMSAMAGAAMMLTVGLAGAAEHEAEVQAVDIGSRLELFVDTHLIERMDGVALRLHAPIRQPRAESTVHGGYMTVIFDEQEEIYRAYFRSRDPNYTGPRFSGNPGEITRYAESRDGHEWEFPSLGLFEIDGSRDNNVILAGYAPASCNFTPFIDTREGIDPSERYKALGGHPSGGVQDPEREKDGLHGFVSADGIHWRKVGGEGPVVPFDQSFRHAFDSQNVVFWCEVQQLYVCYFRVWETSLGLLRSVARTTSPDFFNWSEWEVVEPNFPDEHLYTNQTHPYFRAPHIYIATPTRYIPNVVRGEEAEGNVGSTDVMLMTKRAGADRFDRHFKEGFIRPGLDQRRWGNRSNYAALNVVPTGPQEMSMYLRGDRYTLRTDGFASAWARADGGELVTKPVIFQGGELVLNYSTSAGGSVQVEIQDVDGAPIEGFALEDCQVFIGDHIERVVAWQGSADLAALAGQPVRLRFVIKDGDVYSYRFR